MTIDFRLLAEELCAPPAHLVSTTPTATPGQDRPTALAWRLSPLAPTV